MTIYYREVCPSSRHVTRVDVAALAEDDSVICGVRREQSVVVGVSRYEESSARLLLVGAMS